MAKVHLPSTALTAVSVNAGNTRYVHAGNSGLLARTTETDVQVTWNVGGTLSNLTLRVSTNATTASSTFRTRLNAGNGGQSVSIGAGATGFFEDTTNTDTIASGDEVNYQMVAGTGGAIAFVHAGTVFDATTNRSMIYVASTLESRSAAATRHASIGGGDETSSGEDNAETTMLVAGTARNMSVRVLTNPRSGTSTFLLRKNNADTALTLSIGAGATGYFEDASNTVAVAADDEICFGNTVGTGSGSMQWIGEALQYDTTTGQYQVCANSGGGTIAFGVTSFMGFAGDAYSATETDAECRIQIAEVGQKLYFYSAINTLDGATTVTLRENGADTSVTLSVGAGATGWFTDATNTNTFADDDRACIELTAAGTTGSMTFSATGVVMGTSTSAPANVEPGLATLTFTGYAPTIATPRTMTPGVATLSFTGYAPTIIVGVNVLPGVAAMTFTGYAPTIVTPRTVLPGVAAMTFTGYAPTVTVGVNVYPSPATLSFTGYAPVIALPKTVVPGVAALTFTGYAPAISVSNIVRPGVAAMSFTGYAPTITTPIIVRPGVAVLVFTGYAPLSVGQIWTPRTQAGASWTERTQGAATWTQR